MEERMSLFKALALAPRRIGKRDHKIRTKFFEWTKRPYLWQKVKMEKKKKAADRKPKKPKIRLLDDPAFLAWKGAEEMDKYGFEWQKRIWLKAMARVKRLQAERELREKEQREKADREEKARKEDLEERKSEKRKAERKVIAARPAKPKIHILDDPTFLTRGGAEDMDKHGLEWEKWIWLKVMAYEERVEAETSLQKAAVYLPSDQPTSWMWLYVRKVENPPLAPRRNSI